MADWEDVTVLRKKQPNSSQLRSQQAINQAMRQGVPVETTKKYEAGSNKQHAPSRNTTKLDQETEELRHDHIGLDVGRLIQQGRQQKSLTQKDLATKICEKPNIISDYETGKAIPNQQVLGKLERALGIKLRGKDKGQPL